MSSKQIFIYISYSAFSGQKNKPELKIFIWNNAKYSDCHYLSNGFTLNPQENIINLIKEKKRSLYNLFMKHRYCSIYLTSTVTKIFSRVHSANLINPVHSCKVNDESLRMEILIFICIHSRKVLLWVFIFLPRFVYCRVSLRPRTRKDDRSSRKRRSSSVAEYMKKIRESCQTGLAKTWLLPTDTGQNSSG